MASFRKTDSGKWQARVSIKGKIKSLGTFATKKEAEAKAAWFEKEMKPTLIKEELLELLEKDLLVWQQRLEQFSGLEKFTIQLHLEKLETTIKIYKREKDETENALIDKISIC